MRLSPATLLFFASFSATAQTAAPNASPAKPSVPAPAAAPATMTTYRDDALHFTYTYPSNYTDASAVVGPALQASLGDDPTSAAAARCMTLPFSRMAASPATGSIPEAAAALKPSTGPRQIGIVALVHADAACLKRKFNAKSLVEFTEGEAQGLAAAGAKTNFGQPVSYELASHPAALLQGTFSLPAGQLMQALVACVLDTPDIVCWQFLATSTDRLRTMVSFPVTFDDTPTTPTVPATLLRP